MFILYINVYICIYAGRSTPRSGESAIGDLRSSEGSLFFPEINIDVIMLSGAILADGRICGLLL